MRGSLAVGMNGSVFSEPVKECRRAEWLGGDRFHWGPLSLRYLAEEGGPRGHGLCGGWKSGLASRGGADSGHCGDGSGGHGIEEMAGNGRKTHLRRGEDAITCHPWCSTWFLSV